MTRYLDRVLAGEAPTVAEWNEHVAAFHRTYSGATENLLLRMRTPGGETSYDVLASKIKALAPDARDILDIGCGDGALLARLADVYASQVALTGIDFSESDLARARERLPEATLLRGDALEADMGQKSYDVVTSHLVFMVMPEVRAIFERAHGTLRKPGLLAFVVEDPLGGGTVFNLLTSAIAVVRARFPHFAPSVPGRAPMETSEEMRALLEDAGFSQVSIERFGVCAKLSAEQLWAFVEGSYPFGLLDTTLRTELRNALLAQAEKIANSGEDSVLLLRLVTALA